jgi:hypothetical protein
MVPLLIAAILAAVAILLWYLPRNKNLPLRLTARIPAGFLMCASLLALLAFLFRGAMCGQYEFPPTSSRDGKLFAQVSEVDCGAADHFHSSVQLWRDRQGYLAYIFGKRGRSTTVMTVAHDPRLLEVAWRDNRTLIVRYPNDSRYAEEYRCQPQFGDIRIECIGYMPDYTKAVGRMPPARRWLR